LWEAVLPEEWLRLPAELTGVDLLDDEAPLCTVPRPVICWGTWANSGDRCGLAGRVLADLPIDAGRHTP
jgi:hypothetical protein